MKFANFLKITNSWKYRTLLERAQFGKKFLYLNHIESKDFIGYVICKTCKQALKHNKSTDGTTHLNDHKNNANIMQKYLLK